MVYKQLITNNSNNLYGNMCLVVDSVFCNLISMNIREGIGPQTLHMQRVHDLFIHPRTPRQAKQENTNTLLEAQRF